MIMRQELFQTCDSRELAGQRTTCHASVERPQCARISPWDRLASRAEERVSFGMVQDYPDAGFTCPQCQTRYTVVRVEVQAHTPYEPLFCLVCDRPLASTDGECILKYLTSRMQRRVSSKASAEISRLAHKVNS
jgi:hypothetical protein